MKNLKYIIVSFLLGGSAVGGVMSLNLGAAPKLTTKELTDIQTEVLKTHPDNISWVKPTTDAEWAEDVKSENFDIKSTGVLQKMIESHSAKLERELAEFPKYRDCPDCIRWEMRELLQNSGFVGKELEIEIEKQTLEAINNRSLSIEKLKQSVERMQKEIELRDKGFVVVENELLLGSSLPNNRIRKIND